MPRIANPYVRVTEVIDFIDSHWKQYWLRSVGFEEADRISEEATGFGKGVHRVAESHLKGLPTPDNLTERQLYCGGLLVDWCKEADLRPILVNGTPLIEQAITSEVYKYRGTPDVICTFKDQATPWIGDWKTSKDCRRGYMLQLAAYAQAVEETFGIKADDGFVARTPSDPNVNPQFETHTFHELKSKYLPVFLEGLDIFYFFRRKGKWKT